MSLFLPWNDLIRRVAVAAGSATALITLLQPAPVRVACLRGGLAWVAVRLLGWFIGGVLRQVEALEQREAERLAVQLWEADQAAEAEQAKGGAS